MITFYLVMGKVSKQCFSASILPFALEVIGKLISIDLSHSPLELLADSLLQLFTREFSVTFEK